MIIGGGFPVAVAAVAPLNVTAVPHAAAFTGVFTVTVDGAVMAGAVAGPVKSVRMPVPVEDWPSGFTMVTSTFPAAAPDVLRSRVVHVSSASNG